MKKPYIVPALLLALSLQAQEKIQPGTYVSKSLGQDMKLHIKPDKKYELVIFHGDYEVANDTINFNPKAVKNPSDFAVDFSNEANPSIGKVKVKLSGSFLKLYSSAIYIGTQNGTSEPTYQSFSELSTDLNEDATEASFEILRGDHIYLVSDNYTGVAKISKYKMPRDQNQINIEYAPDSMRDVQLIGLPNANGDLVVSEKSKRSPLVFSKENAQQKQIVHATPVETSEKTNWTYPGKQNIYDDYAVAAVDENIERTNSFKLTVEKTLAKATESAKKSKRYLVVSYDVNNKNEASSFNEFIKTQENDIGYYGTDDVNEFIKYDFYQATSSDKKWAEKNKISSGTTAVLDEDGRIIATLKGNVNDNKNYFYYYNLTFTEQLDKAKQNVQLNEALSKKNNDKEILKVLASIGGIQAWNLYPPMIEDVKMVETTTGMETSSVPGPVETVSFKSSEVDQVKLVQAWQRIVDSNSKEKIPNNDFINAAVGDIAGQGFFYKLFDKPRPMDETTWKATEYLLQFPEHKLTVEEIPYSYGEPTKTETNVANYLGKALSLRLTPTEYGVENRDKLVQYYKRVIDALPANHQNQLDYFSMVYNLGRDTNVDDLYLNSFENFHKEFFENKNEVLVLDKLYTDTYGNSYGEDWFGFKNKFSNACNQAAWYVVGNVKNPAEIQRAIKWSETSLKIEKNNPYYLDTLAQLYYLNGDKQKGISTQEEAMKRAEKVEETVKADMQDVLVRMKNGTY